jgi:hypothetical protein
VDLWREKLGEGFFLFYWGAALLQRLGCSN